MRLSRFAAVALATLATVALPAAAKSAPRPTMPVGFQPSSTSWLTDLHGYLLGYAPCTASTWCAYLLETTDGAASWRQLTAPPLPLPANHNNVRITFVSTEDAFATDGTVLQASYDGGRSWSAITLVGLGASHYIFKVTEADDLVLAIAATQGNSDRNTTMLYSGPTRTLSLTAVAGLVATGTEVHGDISTGGAIQLSLGADYSGDQYWTSTDGIHFSKASAPCAESTTTRLGGVRDGKVLALCAGSGGFPAPGENTKQLQIAPKLGAEFDGKATAAPLNGGTAAFTASSATNATIAAVGGDQSLLYSTTDSGRTWRSTVLSERGFNLADLAFSSPQVGVVVDGVPDAGSAVYRTVDGGHTWQELSFG